MPWTRRNGASIPPKQSPLDRKPPPRRAPGQSLAEERRSDLLDQLVPWVTLPVFCWFLFFMEIVRLIWKVPPSPTAMAIVAVVATGLSAYKIRAIVNDLRSVGKGIRGERYVGQVLEDLCRPRGFHVLHDLPSPTGDSNVDHVLIGPEGVFAVETKHYYRPTRGSPKIVYDGKTLHIPGVTPETDLLGQTCAAANHVRDALRRTTGRDVYVRPVLIFAGWFVEHTSRRPEVWVLNESHLPAFLDHEDLRLSPEDIALYADRLNREQVGT